MCISDLREDTFTTGQCLERICQRFLEDVAMNTHAADENVKEEAMLAPIEVDWDGPDDPKNPLNWSSTLRYGHVATVSALTLLT